jgi:asparagine synthetase B (glutamine-hydrolysing)
LASPLIKLIRNAVKPYPQPAVNISGIDSTIILHHLKEQTEEPIHTYTVNFPNDVGKADVDFGCHVSEHYGTIHHTVHITQMLPTYRMILRYFTRPRYNLWPYWAAQEAHNDGCETCYIGEGGDEHFGGYWYKPPMTYVEHWTGFFTYVYPTYQQIYEHLGLRLEVPFHPDHVNWRLTLQFYDVLQEKRYLRKAYRGILPKFVTERRKHNGRFSYEVMWHDELHPYFPDEDPQSEEEIRHLLNQWVTQEWLQSHKTVATHTCLR